VIYTPELARHAELLRRKGLEELLERRLIFTVTSGRSGTQTLAELLACAQDTYSVHEPDPTFSHCLRSVQRRPDLALEFLVEEKLPAILATGAACYAETSHLACKGFIEPMLELGLRPHFVILERDCRAVAKSFLRLNSIPERTALGQNYMLSPADPCLLPTPCWDDFDDYQLCYWYALETQRRARWYAALFDRIGIGYTPFDFVSINSFAAMEKLLDSCGLVAKEDAPERFAEVTRQPMNTKVGDKWLAARGGEVSDPDSLQHAEHVVRRACKAGPTDDYSARLRAASAKAA
jgi:hypothetical protein